MNTTLIFSIFQFFFKIKYYPITRKKQNENYIFCIFFLEFKTHIFLVLTKVKFSSPNDVMKFINTETRKYFFQFFLTKNQHKCIYFINLQKKY